MKASLPPFVERGRVRDGELASDAEAGVEGAFLIPGPLGMRLKVVASDGRHWKEAGLPGEPWEHVSVSLDTRRRTPTWTELEFVKRIWWRDDEWAMQLHAPPAKHINWHQGCLHLWRPCGQQLPLPPGLCV